MLRQAKTEDAVAIAKVHQRARAAAMPWLPVLHTPEEDEAYFRDQVLPVQQVLVAELSNELAGFVAFEKDWLHHLYVMPDHWRSGVGSRLLGEAQAASTVLQLWTFQRNAGARAFYARHGFEEAELTDGAGNEEKTPDVRMVWHRV